MILEYSRYKFIWFQDKPFTSENAVYAHELAFRFFHGIPKFVIYDQDSVFLYDENIGGDYLMTEVFNSYIKSRPFKPVFCRKADPRKQGGENRERGQICQTELSIKQVIQQSG